MRIAMIDALEIHPSERAARRRTPLPVVKKAPRQLARPPLRTLLRDLTVALVTSAACWMVVG